LQIVDRDKHWGSLGEPFDHRTEGGHNSTLVRHRAVGVDPQQHAINGQPLRWWQRRKIGVVQVFQQCRQ
jgi:hypothetical protein